MSSEIITNQEKFLSDVVNNILPSSRNLYFLVGYFYFSGFEEIYRNVSDKNVKILVGLEIESEETMETMVQNDGVKRWCQFLT